MQNSQSCQNFLATVLALSVVLGCGKSSKKGDSETVEIASSASIAAEFDFLEVQMLSQSLDNACFNVKSLISKFVEKKSPHLTLVHENYGGFVDCRQDFRHGIFELKHNFKVIENQEEHPYEVEILLPIASVRSDSGLFYAGPLVRSNTGVLFDSGLLSAVIQYWANKPASGYYIFNMKTEVHSADLITKFSKSNELKAAPGLKFTFEPLLIYPGYVSGEASIQEIDPAYFKAVSEGAQPTFLGCPNVECLKTGVKVSFNGDNVEFSSRGEVAAFKFTQGDLGR